MKVYVVYHSYMPTLEDIFTSREEAEKCATALSQKWGSIWIREYDLKDEFIEGETEL